MPADSSPTVVEVLRFEDLPLGSTGSRRAIVRWSDGSEGEAIRFYRDEVLSPATGPTPRECQQLWDS